MDIFDEMFTNFRYSARRVETLPIYQIEGGEWEEFQQYAAGNSIASFANQGWLDDISAWTSLGKVVERIRVIPDIFDGYLRYEFEWCYSRNLLAGEQIYCVSQQQYQSRISGFNGGDYWLFDQKFVLKLEYDKDGHYIGEKFMSSDLDILPFTRLFDDLLSISIPLSTVLSQLRKASIKVTLN